MILDLYFKRPIFYDYIIAIITISFIYIIEVKTCFTLPKYERILTISSDLSNISFTAAGFILTLLTVLITFKSSSTISKNNYKEDESLFNLFFVSSLYFQTVKILKNCIKSLIFISFIGYSLKLGLPKSYLTYIFYFNILALIVIVLTLYRCLLLLTKILKMQE